MKPLPENVQPYQETQRFTEYTMPAGLRKRHMIKPGTWGLIKVNKGQLRLRLLGVPEEAVTLTPERAGVIPPEVPHEVEPLGEVEFYVQFLK